MSPTELLAGGYRMGRQLVHALTDDLTAEEFKHQPVPGANSAAWIVGHLAVTARRTALRLGATGLPELTEEFISPYSATKKTAGVQTELGEKAELLKLFDVCVEKLMEAVRAIPVESLSAPPARTPFATNYAEAVLFGAMHITLHCGQLSTIRRSLGKPPMV
ncbi:MAG: DinB family protein [Planctomycetia bacterium]|nr:DinB family protein [Planctomycetia bacterium]